MGHIHKQLVGRAVVPSAVIGGMPKDDCEVPSTTYHMYQLSPVVEAGP